ncbi:hypothetical protein BDR04DRAFT_1092670, partial [Suillus decipiens]
MSSKVLPEVIIVFGAVEVDFGGIMGVFLLRCMYCAFYDDASMATASTSLVCIQGHSL